MSRRSVLRALGLGAVAAPIVVAVTASPAAAQSCAGIEEQVSDCPRNGPGCTETAGGFLCTNGTCCSGWCDPDLPFDPTDADSLGICVPAP